MNFVPKLLRVDYHSDLVNPAQKLDFPVLGFVWLVLFCFLFPFKKKKTKKTFFFLIYFYFMVQIFACMYACLVLLETRKGLLPWDVNYRWFCVHVSVGIQTLCKSSMFSTTEPSLCSSTTSSLHHLQKLIKE